MISLLFSSPLGFLAIAASLVIAISVHEYAHAYMADRLGDPTPRLQGRLTLDPRAHLDPIGTLMILFIWFGWGRPVQFDPFNLSNPRRDAATISLAGPMSNLITATLASIILHAISINTALLGGSIYEFISIFLYSLIRLNVILAVFNLIPIHPLDGFKIVGGLLPHDQAREWYSLERYGIIFLFLLIFPIFGRTAPLATLISPPINFLLNILLPRTPFI